LTVEFDQTVGYFDNGTYQLFVQSIPHVHIHVADFLWHKDILLKVNVFA
jgi:hypothetical protein